MTGSVFGRMAQAAGLSLVLALATSAAADEAPRVVVTVKPVHSLAAQVMDGVAMPELLIDGAASPHHFSLRPAQMGALENADAIIWVGPELESFLPDTLAALNAQERSLALLQSPGLTLRDYEDGHSHAHEAGHDHGHDHDHDHDHAHEGDHDHGHGHDHAHEGDHDHGHGHDHAHDGVDPHIWLSPENAVAMTRAIAEFLAQADPAHADVYRANAAAAAERLTALDTEIKEAMADIGDTPYLVFHDAYGYFETRYGLTGGDAITVNPERAPGAARLSELRERMREDGIVCVFSEPQFEPQVVSLLVEDTDARTAELDPLGGAIPASADHYAATLKALAGAMAGCLTPQS
jgi:zinc transport system substrate-binding protein